MKRILVALIVLSVALMGVGSTFADFSDVEVSRNFAQTGNIDLKVVKYDDNWNSIPGVDFTDDEPWGAGLVSCFDIPDLQVYPEIYPCNLLVWNAGSLPGNAYVHLKIVEDLASVASKTWVKIGYDINNDGDFGDAGETIEGWLADLACHHIPSVPTWPLEENAVHRLSIEVYFDGSCPSGFTLAFDTEFILLSGFYCDTEKSHSSFTRVVSEDGGTPGFWSSPGAVNKYGKDNIVTWFRQIVDNPGYSKWFADVTITGDLDTDYDIMCSILKNVGGGGYEGRVNQFRAHYLAARLNTKPTPPRLALGTVHNITHVPVDGNYIDASIYFGYDSGTLGQIITTIESKETDGDIFHEPPSKDNILIMKDVCDALNNVKI